MEQVRVANRHNNYFCIGATMIEKDGALRVLGSLTDNHFVTILPYGGIGTYCWDVNAAQWFYTDCTQGNIINIDCRDCVIDGAPHGAVTPDVDYYLYVYRDLTSLLGMPDLSRTPPGSDHATGFLIKAGNPSRRLVGGLHYQSGGLNLGFGPMSYNTGSYFNRLTINVSSGYIGLATPNTAWTNVTTPTTRLGVWSWGDGTEPTIFAHGTITNYTQGVNTYVGISCDGAAPARWQQFAPAFVGQAVPFSIVRPMLAISGGMHFYDLMIRTDPGGVAAITSYAEITAKIND